MTSKRSAVIALLLGTLATGAAAQGTYPQRPVRLIVPLAAGGGMDTITRALAARLTESMGQTVVIDNRGGGGGTVGAELAASAPPDGYTLLMMSATAVIRPLMYENTRYDIARDFVAISQVTSQPYVLTVNPAVPAKSLQDLISFAKTNPGKLNYASAGQGSIIHLTSELFNRVAGVKTVHVPYKGIGAAYPDILANNVQMVFASIVSVLPHLKGQRLRAVAVTGPSRSKSIPEVPTANEAGAKGFVVTNWYGLVAPARTPQPIVERLNRDVMKVVHDPELAQRYAADGAEGVGSTPQQFGSHIKAEHDKWAKL
ncbi:MAG TPA: tripartite tricarboxylate transporter substrate binding protein, partial [Burkholderiales bacterium]|nr:tripartite tricarboxylate transporter substrate binding protein [Burkholderiales bacterium]